MTRCVVVLSFMYELFRKCITTLIYEMFPTLVDPIRHVITDPIYPYPYRVVITTLVAEQLDACPDLCYVSDMPWPESWPIRAEDVAFADSAAANSTSVAEPPNVALP